VDNNLAASLKNSTSGSDFCLPHEFTRVVASTLALENLKNWQEQPQRLANCSASPRPALIF